LSAHGPRPPTNGSSLKDVERLFREYHDPLVRYLTRRLGDRDWAEEVAQETFVRALRQNELQNERAWLFAVATNLVRDEARKDARRRRHLELLSAEAKAESVVQPTNELERAEERALARRAIDALTERDREALLMREEGLDYNEIAEALQLSLASVGTTLSRARRRLVEVYETLRAEADGQHKAGA
jgi:RNA polymerase sigma-70 factor (ECF subfamily)